MHDLLWLEINNIFSFSVHHYKNSPPKPVCCSKAIFWMCHLLSGIVCLNELFVIFYVKLEKKSNYWTCLFRFYSIIGTFGYFNCRFRVRMSEGTSFPCFLLIPFFFQERENQSLISKIASLQEEVLHKDVKAIWKKWYYYVHPLICGPQGYIIPRALLQRCE